MGYPVDAVNPALVARRPGALTVALALAFFGAVGNIASALGIVLGGKDAISAFVRRSVPESFDSEMIEEVIAAQIREAYSLLVGKALAGAGAAVLLLAIVAICAWGRKSRRGLLIVVLLANVVTAGLQLGETGVLPDLSVAGAVLAVGTSLVAVPFLLIPSVGRYGREPRSQVVVPSS